MLRNDTVTTGEEFATAMNFEIRIGVDDKEKQRSPLQTGTDQYPVPVDTIRVEPQRESQVVDIANVLKLDMESSPRQSTNTPDQADKRRDTTVSESSSLSDVYENKEYVDSISSHTSTTPLLNNPGSIWTSAKELDGKPGDVSTPVIGLIEHPGFMSSQRDLSSTTNISFACQKALRYLQDDRVASSLLLPGSCKDVSKQLEDGSEDGTDHYIVPSGRHTRNLIALSACLTMAFIACGTLRNLQTSINHKGGVGYVSLSMTFFGFVIGSICSPFLVQNFHPYRSLLASLVPHVIYVGANFYPAMWLMAPASFLYGISFAIIWNAMSTYITFLAKGFSEKKNEDYEHTLSRFFGIFYLIWQLYMIFGNLIASFVFTYVKGSEHLMIDTSNDTDALLGHKTELYDAVILNESSYNVSHDSSSSENICGAKYGRHYVVSTAETNDNHFAKYILCGIFMGVMGLASLIAFFLLEPLNSRLFSSARLSVGAMKTQIVSLGYLFRNRKFLFLCPLLLFSHTQAAFATGEISKAFVTCSLGVHMVGYTMICFGVAGSISAYLSGWLIPFCGRTVLIAIGDALDKSVAAVVFDLALLTFMALWEPSGESTVLIFVLCGLWGIADGIWMSQSNSLIGVMFRDQFEEAFSGMRVMQGLGPTIAFAYAQSFCMATKIYIIGVVCVLAGAGYLVSAHVLHEEIEECQECEVSCDKTDISETESQY